MHVTLKKLEQLIKSLKDIQTGSINLGLSDLLRLTIKMDLSLNHSSNK
jgi:hypothetical protein